MYPWCSQTEQNKTKKTSSGVAPLLSPKGKEQREKWKPRNQNVLNQGLQQAHGHFSNVCLSFSFELNFSALQGVAEGDKVHLDQRQAERVVCNKPPYSIIINFQCMSALHSQLMSHDVRQSGVLYLKIGIFYLKKNSESQNSRNSRNKHL